MSAAVLHKRNLAQAVHDLIKHSSPDGADIAATIDALAYVISDLVNMPMMLTLMHESDAKKYLVEYAKRKSAPAVAPEKSKAAAQCANCGGSGSNPGSTSLDCTHCDASMQHKELGKFLASNYADPDCAWKVHQRAYAMGVAAAEARMALTDEQIEEILDRTPGPYIGFARAVLAASAAPKVKP